MNGSRNLGVFGQGNSSTVPSMEIQAPDRFIILNLKISTNIYKNSYWLEFVIKYKGIN